MLILLIIFMCVIESGLCRDCEFLKSSTENIKATLEYNPEGFRHVFPKSYNISYYTLDSVCNDKICCVFPEALLLSHAWNNLLIDIWKIHVNYSLILDLKHVLAKIADENTHMDRFQEENDLSKLQLISSTPETLLNITAKFLDRWLNVDCKDGPLNCIPSLSFVRPTLNINVVRKSFASIPVCSTVLIFISYSITNYLF
ncbi:hypothetical protein KM759_gp110 [Lymphocystis disease virus 4]|uniref:Uncharacterized protein n=1 Tax=Lymphocystis disease virus 4 TaxID=2704413 RepID=A0A6B9XL52_9VIRU|nr:hypothetical protein KM759_gp110 [Lymphocystis disease virus 4]QHR78509.1 hypothetical protein [Lymphocystis disease virus 4]